MDKGIDKTTGDKLVTQYLTNKLIDKKKSCSNKWIYDLVIYAQDFDQTGKIIGCKTYIEGDWYAVSYYNSYDQHCVIIPLKYNLNDIIKIDDIVELEYLYVPGRIVFLPGIGSIQLTAWLFYTNWKKYTCLIFTALPSCFEVKRILDRNRSAACG